MWKSLLFLCGLAAAEDGLAGWLRYAPLQCDGCSSPLLPANIVALNATKTSPVYMAGIELQKGFRGLFNSSLTITHEKGPVASSITVGTLDQYASDSHGKEATEIGADGYWLNIQGSSVQILGQNERGALYGTFEYLSRLAQGNYTDVSIASTPDAPIRWVNQWDNFDGGIERGYGGRSIFFFNGTIKEDLTRVSEYARLLASIGINAVVVNNVNANYTLLKPENIDGLGRIADVLRPYGIQMGLSLYFASPANLTDIDTFDPLNDTVVQWWHNKTAEIYERIPDFAGYLVKANSEGQPGPLTYNRTLADGANMFARALKPFGGIVMFRAFVYNQFGDWNDWYADRANAAVEFFKHLDGQFMDNVVVQIKYGPIDFQVREPPSPLFANIPQTATAIELQITQEFVLSNSLTQSVQTDKNPDISATKTT
jgi:alpha-glucuronidase